MTSAVVLGGGLGGMLAAAAVARHVDDVTVVESDRFPESVRPRKGIPQAHHNHMLMGGGARALDELLPGATDRLYAADAQRRGLSDILTLAAEGWCVRGRGEAHVIACSRGLIDHVVREQALRDERITVLEGTEAAGLTGDSGRVTGVRLQGGTEELPADLVVDATGRRSKAPDWLAELGASRVEEDTLDAGFAYATRLYQAPEGVHDTFPGVLIQPRADPGEPGRGAAVMPNEDGRLIVVMIGTRGGQPPTDEDGFLEFARNLRHPIAAELLRSASPLGEIRSYRGMANRRRRFEKLPVPEGFVVLGDAATALNPVYAHGMSVAALGVLALHRELERRGPRAGLAAAAQSAIAKAGDFAWSTAINTDRWFSGVETNMRLGGGGMQKRFAARYARTAAGDAALADAMFDVASLAAPPNQMMSMSNMLTVLRGPRREPLSADEAIAQFPELGDLREPVPAERPE